MSLRPKPLGFGGASLRSSELNSKNDVCVSCNVSCLVHLFADVPLVAPPRLVTLPQLDAQGAVEVLAALGRELVEYHLVKKQAWRRPTV